MLVFNECWGVVSLDDGFAVACGAGIETCDGVGASLVDACAAGRGDERAGAKLFPAEQWASLAVKIDLNGTLLWQRVDQHSVGGDAGVDDGAWVATSSAAECGVSAADGGLAYITDEWGLGL